MKAKEQIFEEIRSLIESNKAVRDRIKEAIGKCNCELSDIISQLDKKEMTLQDYLNKEYERGMNDTWEMVTEIYGMDLEKRYTIFGNDTMFVKILSMNPLEIKQKLSSYREEKDKEKNDKVRVGDIVEHKHLEIKAVILDVAICSSVWHVFTEDGASQIWEEKDFVKTGQTKDVRNILFYQ